MPDVHCITTKKALFISSILFAIFFSACSNKKDNRLAIFKALDESLNNSNQTINEGTLTVIAGIDEKMMEQSTTNRAKIWKPKAMLIQQFSTNIYTYIDRLKADLKREAGLITGEDKESFKEDDRDAVNRLFGTKRKANELHERLKQYKKDILSIDSQMSYVFKNTIQLTTQSFDILPETQQDLRKMFFMNSSTVASLAMLSQFQNNIKNTENRFIQFCYKKIGGGGDSFTFYSAIIGQSSSYLRKGEKIEITAGMGAFSKAALPQIIIGGRSVPLNDNGFVVYKFKASIKPGKHYVPVKIEYVDQDGKRQTIEKQVEYTVAQEAAINN